jgi:hypothetical protein
MLTDAAAEAADVEAGADAGKLPAAPDCEYGDDGAVDPRCAPCGDVGAMSAGSACTAEGLQCGHGCALQCYCEDAGWYCFVSPCK